MRARILIPLAAAAMLAAPASASAFFAHTVTTGESLTSIAAADGLSVAQLAAANGLPLDAYLIDGSTVQIPPQGSTLSGLGSGSSSATTVPVSTSTSSGTSSSGSYVVVRGDTLSGIAARIGTTATALAAANGLDVNGILPEGAAIRLSGSSSGSTTLRVSTTSSGSGSYLVVPGDTLTAIAARAGTTPAAIAAANGLDLNGILLAGRPIHVPSGSTRAARVDDGGRHGRDPAGRRPRPGQPDVAAVPDAGAAERVADRLGGRRRTACRARWRTRSHGRRAASTTTSCPAPTPAGSCRSCRGRGTGSSVN